MKPKDWLHLKRIVRFGETDAAGVIHFVNLIRWCHESWEESLDIYGVKAVDIFPSIIDNKTTLSTALPIVHCEADFFSPIRIGNELLVKLLPRKLDMRSFEVKYLFLIGKDKSVASALIRHFAINSALTEPSDLPEGIDRWLEASSIDQGVSSI